VLDVAFAALGALALGLGLASRRMRHWPVSEPLLALALGVALGPQALGVFAVPADEQVGTLHTAASIVLAISLMAVALRFPLEEVSARVTALALLTVTAMVGMALLSTALVVWIIGLPLASAAVIGACIAPTDPVLASSVVEGEPAHRTLSLRLRVLLSLESAANDALAFPLVIVAVAVATGTGAGEGLAQGAYAIVIGVGAGVPIGLGAGWLVHSADERHQLEHTAFLVLTVALALFTLGTVNLLRGEGILAVLVAGLAYNHALSRKERKEEWEVQEAINRFLILPVFTILGATLPWDGWSALGWQGVALVGAVLVIRRLPIVLALHRPLGLDLPETGFLGWFGPIGVAALFYLATAFEHGALDEPGWAVGTLVVVTSTVVHGITAAPGRHLLGRAEHRA
jgi:sodium/hydrogen antiporter